jgi:hypothetical protein
MSPAPRLVLGFRRSRDHFVGCRRPWAKVKARSSLPPRHDKPSKDRARRHSATTTEGKRQIVQLFVGYYTSS